MAATLPRFRATDPTDRVADALRGHGAVIVEGVLAPDVLARFNAEIDPFLATAPCGRSASENARRP